MSAQQPIYIKRWFKRSNLSITEKSFIVQLNGAMTEDAELCTKISDKVKMAGFLEKKGSMLWKRYWFVLEDSLLLYYKSQLEYLNLSPCRGSVNMGLVSSVQPRRNSKECIIHLVSRTQTLVLKAKDRETQEKWLQSLLESAGKSGVLSNLSAFRFSLDDLPGQVESMTLPRRLHSGSLDTVWKPAANIPKSKMIDKVLTYEEEVADENQNTSLTHQQKSATLDSRRGDFTLVRLKNAIGRRKVSTPGPGPGTPKLGKQRRESFLRKIFKKSSTKVEEQEVHIQVQESDSEDPLYDKIQNPSGVPGFGCKNVLLEIAMAELKGKLKSRDSLEGEDEKEEAEKPPPALPPRGSLTALNTLANDNTTVATIHQIEENIQKEDLVDDSEDSELSGHYQRINKTGPKSLDVESNEESDHDFGYQKVRKPPDNVSDEPECSSIPPIEDLPITSSADDSILLEAQYTVVNKSKKKKKLAPQAPVEGNEKSDEAIPEAEMQSMQNNFDAINVDLLITEESNETPIAGNSVEISEGDDVRTDWVEEVTCNQITECAGQLQPHDTSQVTEEETESAVQKQIDENLDEVENGFPEELSEITDNTERGSPTLLTVFYEEPPGGKNQLDETNDEASDVIKESDNTVSNSYDSCFEGIIQQPPICNHGTELKIVQVLRKSPRSSDQAVKEEQVQIPLSDLNTLLLRLQEITTAPLPQTAEPLSWSGSDFLCSLGTLKRRHSDPDYDIPRPHAPAIDRDSSDQIKLTATGFFNSIEKNGSANSLEPDSLESKKEEKKEEEETINICEE